MAASQRTPKRPDKPVFRNYGPLKLIPAECYDWLDGERFTRDCKVAIRRVEMLHRPTGRYRRWWQVQEDGALGWQLGRTPTQAVRHISMPTAELRRVVREAKALT